LFIPDPDPDFFYPSRIPNPGLRKAPDPGSGLATLLKIRSKKLTVVEGEEERAA
jgi:hypothetical protein